MPWMAPMLCPRGEARKIGASGPSEKRSVNPIFSAARVSSLCMTALGRPVVLDVNIMCARSAALAGKGALRLLASSTTSRRNRRTGRRPDHARRSRAASRAISPSRAVPWHSIETSAPRARQSGSVGDRFGIGAGRQTRRYGTETQQCDERHLPVDDVRQKKDHDVAATDSARFQLFGEASALPPQHAVAKPPTA